MSEVTIIILIFIFVYTSILHALVVRELFRQDEKDKQIYNLYPDYDYSQFGFGGTV